MKKAIIVLGAFTILITSCGDGTLSVSSYNEKAISLYNPLDARLSNLGEKMMSSGTTPAQATEMLNAAVKSTDSVRTELAKLKPCKEAMAMHTSLMALVDFEKSKMLPALGKVAVLRDKPEELNKMISELNALQSETQVLVTKMTSDQQAMALKSGNKLH